MKISKLFLLPTAAAACTSPILFSCGKEGWTIQDLEDALFHPLDADNTMNLADGIQKMIDEKDEIGLQKEVIYALYVNCMFSPWSRNWPIINDLYNSNFLNMSANIRRCSLDVETSEEGNKYILSFLGYVNFVFIEDYWSEVVCFDKGDFIQITFSIDEWPFKINNNVLQYTTLLPGQCFGFIQTTISKLIIYIDSISGCASAPAPNWHNWIKN